VDLSRLYDGIDIAGTLSNLTGKWIKRITADKDGLPAKYRMYWFDNVEEMLTGVLQSRGAAELAH
jgi:hypothetical protein